MGDRSVPRQGTEGPVRASLHTIGTGPPNRRRSTAPAEVTRGHRRRVGLARFVVLDILSGCIELIHRLHQHPEEVPRARSFRRARAGHPRAAARVPDARVRAAQAAQPRARLVPGALVRLAVPLPQVAGRPRAGSRAPSRSSTPHTVASKRARIVYQLTADGKEHLQQVLASSGPATWEDENFDVRFAFFGQTDAETRLRILEGRRTRLTERLETVRQSFARTRERMDEYTLELQRHGLEQVEREVRWLDGLIDNERGLRRTRPAGTGRPAVADTPAGDDDVAPARTTEKERG